MSMIDKAMGKLASGMVSELAFDPTAVGLLRKSAEIMEERGKQYDSPEGERSMGKAVAALNAITGRDLTEREGWLLLELVKKVREFTAEPGSHAHTDSVVDGTAYSALGGEAALGGRR
jgi:hypothetical protein